MLKELFSEYISQPFSKYIYQPVKSFCNYVTGNTGESSNNTHVHLEGSADSSADQPGAPQSSDNDIL